MWDMSTDLASPPLAVAWFVYGFLAQKSRCAPRQIAVLYREGRFEHSFYLTSYLSGSPVPSNSSASFAQELPAGVDTVVLDLKSCMVDIIPMAGLLAEQPH